MPVAGGALLLPACDPMKNSLVREPDAGNPQVRFDERCVETEHGMRILRHKRGNPGTELCRSLNSLRYVSTLQ